MVGTVGAGYHPGRVGLCDWTIDWRKGVATGFGKNGRGSARARAGGIVYDGVQYSGRELAKSAQRHSSGGDPSEGCERGFGTIPRAEVGARENLPLSDVSRRGVSAVLGEIRLALSVSARRGGNDRGGCQSDPES